MISDQIILLQAACRPSEHGKQDVLRTILQKTLDCSSSLHLLTGTSHFSPQSSLTSSFNTSSFYNSAALTPDTLSDGYLPSRNEETPLGGDAGCKQLSIPTLLQNLSQKVKWHIHPTIRLQRKIKCTTNKGYNILHLQLSDLKHPQP